MISKVCFTFTFLFIESVFGNYETFGPGIHQLTEPVLHGEAPTWDPRTQLLYFVDIDEGKVFSYDPKNGETFYIQLDGAVTPVIQSKNSENEFLVGVNRSLFLINWDGKHDIENQTLLTTVSQEFPHSRFNDGKADKQGRLWIGTIGYENATGVLPHEASLFLITKDNLTKPEHAVSPITVGNGLAWNKANNKFYYIDTPTYKIIEYDYDDESGKLSNPRVVIDLLVKIGVSALPDGMTIDADDNLWIALYGAGSIIKVDPISGNIVRRIALPAQYVTSVMWGGEHLDILFVTTSSRKLNKLEKQQNPGAGSLFAISGLETKGLPVFEADIV